MAEHLASIFGTEKDRVNCPFYFKIGACRHGERCSRLHNKPTVSCTVLIPNMYQSPSLSAPVGPDGLPRQVSPQELTEHYEDFYEDVFEEAARFGDVESLSVCDNVADHMLGNVYIKFRDEDGAAACVAGMRGRYYGGRAVAPEFSPVTDIREATCRQYEEAACNRGGYCNFMHIRPIGRELRRYLYSRRRRRSRSRSRSRDRRRHSPDRRDRDRRDRRGRSPDRRDDNGGGGGGGGIERARDDSAERRARIAAWNRERQGGSGAGSGGAGGEGSGGGGGEQQQQQQQQAQEQQEAPEPPSGNE